MNWASNGVLGVESWQTTKLRQNVKNINNFMAEIEMWHLFVINFWLVCKQTREKYSSFIWSQTFVIFRIIFLSIDHSAPPPSSIKIQRVYIYHTHLSTAVAWREKKFKHFVFNKYFCLVLGVLKSKISKKSNEGLGRKLDFKLFHYKSRVQRVSKITTIAARNRC